MENIEVKLGDITKFKGDAIVNAANSKLLGGGGVDGAIHKAAGHKLLEECKKIGGCPTGEARLSKGYKLSAKWIVHTVGPVWHGGEKGEPELLRSAYLNSLKVAYEAEAKSIAFPAISTGVYGFPKDKASKIALKTVKNFIKENKDLKVVFMCFSKADLEIYNKERASLS